MVKLSIIMPVRNQANFIEESVNKIFNQIFKDFELIIVDNNSSDGTSQIIKSLSKKHDFIKVSSEVTTNLSKARNDGIVLAEGEYITFLNEGDSYLNDNVLKEMMDYATKVNAVMLSANLKIKTELTHDDIPKEPLMHFVKHGVIKPEQYGIPWAFNKNIYKRSFILEHNITFSDLICSCDHIFLANVLINLEKIHTINLDMCTYDYSLKNNFLKMNNYTKKHGYIQHFKDLFDIFSNKKYFNTYTSLKKVFIDYLLFEDNLLDKDIQKIMPTIFNNFTEYYKPYEYGYNILNYIINPTHKEDENLTEYTKIKKCLFEESILDDSVIEEDRLIEFINIGRDDEILNDSVKESFNQIKEIDTNITNEKEEKQIATSKIQEEINTLIGSNNDILTSKSWEFTKSLRSLKHGFKKR